MIARGCLLLLPSFFLLLGVPGGDGLHEVLENAPWTAAVLHVLSGGLHHSLDDRDQPLLRSDRAAQPAPCPLPRNGEAEESLSGEEYVLNELSCYLGSGDVGAEEAALGGVGGHGPEDDPDVAGRSGRGGSREVLPHDLLLNLGVLVHGRRAEKAASEQEPEPFVLENGKVDEVAGIEQPAGVGVPGGANGKAERRGGEEETGEDGGEEDDKAFRRRV